MTHPYDHVSALASLGIEMERTDWIPRAWRFPRIPPDFDQRYPYYKLVPKDFYANLNFRVQVLRLGQRPENQYQLWLMCKRDPLFFLNAFAYIREPRGEEEMVKLPWITWPLQDALWAELDECWGRENFCVEKSREQGVTWLAHAAKPVHDFLFKSGSLIGLCSANQDKVDKIDNEGTMFAMIRFLLVNLPFYLKPDDVNDKLLTVASRSRENGIDGSPTKPDMFRGDRRRAIGVDEAASIANSLEVDQSLTSVTRSRIDVSTPKGATGSFFRRTRPDSGTRKATLHWTINPIHAEGLYFDEKGRPRSPWYDAKCRELNNHPVIIAQELDISYTASDYMYFLDDKLRLLQERHSRTALKRGKLHYEVVRDKDGRATDVKPIEFIESPAGDLELWCMCRSDGSPVRGAYAAGADVSMGTGASNSAGVFLDVATGDKAAQLVTSRLQPNEFAEYMAALGRWFGGPGGQARLGWERNGPGGMLADVFMRIGYENLYYEKDEERDDKKRGRKPGWWSVGKKKRLALDNYASALYDGVFIEHSEHAYEEHRMYIVGTDGSIEHSAASTVEDPTGAGDNHGDIVIANIVSWMVSRDVDSAQELVETDPDAPWGSWEEREAALEAAKAERVTKY